MIQQFFPDDDVNHFHSSGYAEAAHGRSIGSVGTQSYRQRLHLERNRQHVNRYGHSHLGRPLVDARPNGIRPEAEVPLRARLNTGASRPASSGSSRPQGFSEPPSRTYNPYQ